MSKTHLHGPHCQNEKIVQHLNILQLKAWAFHRLLFFSYQEEQMGLSILNLMTDFTPC